MRAVALAIVLFGGLSAAEDLNADELLKLAINAQQKGDFATAIADYRKVLELRPDTLEAKVNLGAALVHVGEYDAGISAYQSALQSAPYKNPILLNLGLAYYKKGDLEHAREEFEILHAAQSNDVQAAILLGDTDVRLGKYATAVTMLAPMETTNSENLDFEYVLGSAMIKAGKRREGVARVEKVADSGKSADAYLLAGSTLLQLDEYERARHDLDAALRLDPKLPGIYSLAGTARDKNGDVKEAENAFKEALRLDSNDFTANLYLGAILYKRRQLVEARPYLDKALQINPTDSMARYESAMLQSTSGEYQAAAEELEKIVRDDPNWLEPHVELASLYYRLHRPEDGAKERRIVERITAEQQAQGAIKH